MDQEEELLKYERLDIDRLVGKEEATRGIDSSRAVHLTAPSSSSWVSVYVHMPSRLAAFTILSIFIYEVLVLVSMFVRRLRWVMVEWLMPLLLAMNVFLLVLLAVVVWARKHDFTLSSLLSIARNTRGDKDRARKGLSINDEDEL